MDVWRNIAAVSISILIVFFRFLFTYRHKGSIIKCLMLFPSEVKAVVRKCRCNFFCLSSAIAIACKIHFALLDVLAAKLPYTLDECKNITQKNL